LILCDFVYVHLKKFFCFFSGANKKCLLQSGKGIPKSLWWKLKLDNKKLGRCGWGLGIFAIT
jgi:hypothetical protein